MRTSSLIVGAALLVGAASRFALALEAEQPLNMIVEPPVDFASGLETQRFQAVMERYPEIATGPERDGTYVVAAAFRRDGSIYESHMRFAAGADQLNVRDELSALLPQDGRNSSGSSVRKGPWANGGLLPADILLDATVLPPDFDEATSAKRVQDAVRARHSDLMTSPLTGGPMNFLTVFMTRDGRIDREHIQTASRQELRNVFPEYASAENFKVLGLKPDELGRMDITTISRPVPGSEATTQTLPDGRTFTRPPEQEYLIIVYAWPRGMGWQDLPPEPARPAPEGALLPMARAAASRSMSDPSLLREARRREQHVVAELVKRYPEIVDGPERDGYFTFVLLFRADGSIHKEGMRYADTQQQTNADRQELSNSMRGEPTTGMTTLDVRSKGDVLPDGKVFKANISYSWSVLGGGFDLNRLPGNPAEHRNALRRLTMKYFPDVETQRAGFLAFRPWVLLSHDGEVLRTGRVLLDADEIFLAGAHLGPQMPGVRFAEVEADQFVQRDGQRFSVMYVWLAADSPLPPEIN